VEIAKGANEIPERGTFALTTNIDILSSGSGNNTFIGDANTVQLADNLSG
jgi:hypothetical protein